MFLSDMIFQSTFFSLFQNYVTNIEATKDKTEIVLPVIFAGSEVLKVRELYKSRNNDDETSTKKIDDDLTPEHTLSHNTASTCAEELIV